MYVNLTAATRALATPEILEHILLCLLADLIPPTNRDDRRSRNVQANAQVLLHLLRCGETGSVWLDCVLRGPPALQHALFLSRNDTTPRSWDQQAVIYPSQQSYYRGLALLAPVLNPVLQIAFEEYKFRYWRSGSGADGPRHHAYLILTRRHSDAVRERIDLGYGKTVRSMLLAQPPPLELHATSWEREYDSIRYPKQTTAITDPHLRRDNGVTLGDVLTHAEKVFDNHPDLLSIKFTTV